MVKPIYELEKAREKIIIQQKISAAPFYFNEISRKMPTEFEVYFRQGKNEYRYNLSICGDDIVEESLYWKSIGGKRTGMVLIGKVLKLHWVQASIKRVLTAR